MKLLSYTGSLALAFLFSFQVVLAQQIPTIDFFHGRECPHCHKEKDWFPELKKAYPDVVINEYEVWHDVANQALWSKRLAEFDMEPRAVPTNIIGEDVITGFSPDVILAAMEKTYGPPAVDISLEPTDGTKEPADYTWLLIVLAGLGLAGAVAFMGKKA